MLTESCSGVIAPEPVPDMDGFAVSTLGKLDKTKKKLYSYHRVRKYEGREHNCHLGRDYR